VAVKKCRQCGFEFVRRYSGPGRPRELCSSCQPEITKWVGGKKRDKDGRELSQRLPELREPLIPISHLALELPGRDFVTELRNRGV
jgi:hypothetical protein